MNKNKERVEHLTAQLARSTSTIVTNYRGLNTKQLENLRAQLRVEGIEYTVIKNTLGRRAAADADMQELEQTLSGPVALAIIRGDINKAAGIIFEHARKNGKPSMVAGLTEEEFLSQASINQIGQQEATVIYGEESAKVMKEEAQFNVILTSVTGPKINAIKAIREIMGLDLLAAKNFVDSTPRPVLEDVSQEVADSMMTKLQIAGAQAEVLPSKLASPEIDLL